MPDILDIFRSKESKEQSDREDLEKKIPEKARNTMLQIYNDQFVTLSLKNNSLYKDKNQSDADYGREHSEKIESLVTIVNDELAQSKVSVDVLTQWLQLKQRGFRSQKVEPDIDLRHQFWVSQIDGHAFLEVNHVFPIESAMSRVKAVGFKPVAIAKFINMQIDTLVIKPSEDELKKWLSSQSLDEKLVVKGLRIEVKNQ